MGVWGYWGRGQVGETIGRVCVRGKGGQGGVKSWQGRGCVGGVQGCRVAQSGRESTGRGRGWQGGVQGCHSLVLFRFAQSGSEGSGSGAGGGLVPRQGRLCQQLCLQQSRCAQ